MIERRLSIFVIDDDPVDCELLKRYLEEIAGWECQLVIYTNPIDGLKILPNQPVDIIILDYMLGAVNGLEVLRQIRNSGDLRPIILLTGQGDERLAAELTRAGADDYLVKKEMTPDLLRRTIDGAIVQYQLRREKALLEEELRQSQKMEAVGQLAGGLAHDFNNMLTGIMGFVELALLKSRGLPMENDLRQVQSTTRRMAELIQRLLSFSRREKKDYEQVDLEQLFKELELILSHSIPKNVSLRTEVENSLILFANASMLHQILINLCLNAVEAMPEGGCLNVKAHRIETDARLVLRHSQLAPGEYVLIEVEDTGMGISEENRDRIFEPFFTTKTLSSEKGTGLGLAIVWQNVMEHGGAVEVSSAIGKGSRFSVYLPLRVSREQGVTERKKEVIPRGTETILVIDDEQVVRDVASRMLDRLGYRVYSASDGVSALETYREYGKEIDAVLLDLSMPRMGGEECLKHLKELDPKVVILIASGHSLEEKANELIEQGVKGVIQKPFQLVDLATRIRSVLDAAVENGLTGL